MKTTSAQSLCVCLIGSLLSLQANPVADLFAPQTFVRDKGAPVTEEVRFTVPNSGVVVLTVQNGVNGRKASSGTVWLNDTPLLGPADFSQHRGSVELPVALSAGENSLRVQLQGQPGSGITISVAALVDAIDLLPVSSPLQANVDSMACQAVVSALGIPVPGIPVEFTVSGFGAEASQTAYTDDSGRAELTFAPFPTAGTGTVTARIAGAPAGMSDSEDFSVVPATPITVSLLQSSPIVVVPLGGAMPATYDVSVSGLSGQLTHVVFTQEITPASGGLTLVNNYPASGWFSTFDQQWTVSASFGGMMPGPYIVRSTATVVETGTSTSAELVVLVN